MENKHENLASELMDMIGAQDMAKAKTILRDTPAAEIVRVLIACEDRYMAVIFRLLDKDLALTVFELLDPPAQAALLESFTSQEALGMIRELDPDELVRLLDELPAKVAKQIMEALPREQRAGASRLMGYADGTVGRLMSPAAVTVRRNDTAEHATEALRVAAEARDEPITHVYVVDDKRVFLGSVPLSAVVAAKPGTSMRQLLVKQDHVTLLTGQEQEKAARLMKRLDALELPVLDSERRLVGVLTATDALDIKALLPEMVETIEVAAMVM